MRFQHPELQRLVLCIFGEGTEKATESALPILALSSPESKQGHQIN